jgi:hypothetical protein
MYVFLMKENKFHTKTKNRRFVLSYILISRLLYVIRIENILNLIVAIILKTYSNFNFFPHDNFAMFRSIY